jgi:hypothetical protein
MSRNGLDAALERKRIVRDLREAQHLGGRLLARAERALLFGALALGALHVLWFWRPREDAVGLPAMIALSATLLCTTRAVVLGIALHRARRRALSLLDELEMTMPPQLDR